MQCRRGCYGASSCAFVQSCRTFSLRQLHRFFDAMRLPCDQPPHRRGLYKATDPALTSESCSFSVSVCSPSSASLPWTSTKMDSMTHGKRSTDFPQTDIAAPIL